MSAPRCDNTTYTQHRSATRPLTASSHPPLTMPRVPGTALAQRKLCEIRRLEQRAQSGQRLYRKQNRQIETKAHWLAELEKAQREVQKLLASSDSHTGHISKLDATKGYGFIEPDAGTKPVYFKRKHIGEEIYDSLVKGIGVTYVLGGGGSKPQTRVAVMKTTEHKDFVTTLGKGEHAAYLLGAGTLKEAFFDASSNPHIGSVTPYQTVLSYQLQKCELPWKVELHGKEITVRYRAVRARRHPMSPDLQHGSLPGAAHPSAVWCAAHPVYMY